MNAHTPKSGTCSYVMDTEASAPLPNGVMLTCGLVKLDRGLTTTFYGKFRPPEDAEWDPNAEAAHGISRAEAATFPEPAEEAARLIAWVRETSGGRTTELISDNPVFDAVWLMMLARMYGAPGLFGYSGRRIGDLYCGLVRDYRANQKWKERFRPEGSHTHHALEDALSNAKALVAISMNYQIAGLELDI